MSSSDKRAAGEDLPEPLTLGLPLADSLHEPHKRQKTVLTLSARDSLVPHQGGDASAGSPQDGGARSVPKSQLCSAAASALLPDDSLEDATRVDAPPPPPMHTAATEHHHLEHSVLTLVAQSALAHLDLEMGIAADAVVGGGGEVVVLELMPPMTIPELPPPPPDPSSNGIN